MYLKSLVLKGFKSFADRSVLSLEPGITIIVGPNGSGKSNISDAILWVLGEQSAKQLRGQAMEDVIFSGSSARQAVGVAEVDLILDNSCGTLPLDFDEVAITRRMYRNGESEYLINGSPALRRDILDILHDSGIGRDTHSIISQGSLSSVLQSRSEDRRELIEEAAGILKHKRRKERSERKLASMDAHLSRIQDIANEIDRQLRPLEKQAARAQQFAELEDELKDLDLRLAVDDLRGLQAIWNDIEKRDKEAAAEVDLARYRYTDKERELEKLQKMFEEKGLFVGDLTNQRHRCQSIVERLDSNMLLLEEKGNNMVNRTSELRGELHRAQTRLNEAEREFEALTLERETCGATLQVRSKELGELGRQSELLRKARMESDELYSKTSADLRGKQRAIDDCKLKIEKSQASISHNTLEDEMLTRRFAQIDEQFRTTQAALAAVRDKLEARENELAKNKRDSDLAKLDIDKRVRLLEVRKNELSVCRNTHDTIRAEIRGIEGVDRAFESASPALSWVLAHEDEFKGFIHPIANLFKAPVEYEQLLERLLGADLFGLVVDDTHSAELLASRLLSDTSGDGEISLLPVEGAKRIVDERPKTGERLLDSVGFEEANRWAAEALIGDVYLVSDLKTAIAASAADETRHRFVTKEGAVVWPNGKITLGVQVNDVDGVLARRRRFDILQQELVSASASLSDAELALSEAENMLYLAQQDGFELSQAVAMLQGECDSLREDVGRLEQSMTSMSAERSEIEAQRKNVAAKSAATAPLIAELEQRMATIAADVASLEEMISAGSSERRSRTQAESEIREQISNCNVEIATASTREVYLKQRINALTNEIKTLTNTVRVSRETQASLEVLSRRVDPLYEIFQELAEGMKVWANKLRDQALFEQSNSSTLVGAIEDVREAVRKSKDALDEKVDAVTMLRVEKGKIETQVEASIKQIVQENGIMLEVALDVPILEDRNSAEDRANKLRRKMATIGLVNQVAKQEYETLKARRDFIASQVEDLEGARKALSKIVAAIDRKMRNSFLETFEIVDGNFQEIFSTLFPGGHAHLTLTDPDNPETTGVEVHAQPLGKKISKMTLMSGGEKSLTALALLFSVYRTRTVPFYVLDEVDDALDDANLRRLVGYLDSMRSVSQFLFVTHQRRTMEAADVLYGVSMQADGVSKVVSQKIERTTDADLEHVSSEAIQAAIEGKQTIMHSPLQVQTAARKSPLSLRKQAKKK
ncbi:MAG: chromosome segregation protein SMC [Actinobacteria bacterium]|nr:chromosome segregation protein SMC [Actinomycetota bacterium]